MRIVIVESPYAGDVARNVRYARAAVRDCLLRGEAPYASHLLYTQPGVLCDENPEERERGILSGFAFHAAAAAHVVYADLGVSRGMQRAIDAATAAGRVVEERRLGDDWEREHVAREANWCGW